MSTRVFFYVQHLLGVGHVKRASVIARAMAASGLDVAVVLGGTDVAGIDFEGCARILLPPVRAADETIRTLVDERGDPVDDALREARVSRLLGELRSFAPDVVLIEQFPFGRRQFRFELLPLIAAARALARRPRIVSSVRDVLVQKDRPERNREMVRWARAFFDAVLVHGDPAVIPLEASFPEARALADLVRYTGYVVEPLPPAFGRDRVSGRDEVIVSVGGGAVGEPLLRLALAARPLTRFAGSPWRLITGPNMAAEALDRLAWEAPAGVVVDRWRTDMPVLLRNCVLSISQAGYNTVADILQARANAVVVPFRAEGQTEQTLRASMLAKIGVLGMVEPQGLSAPVLARAIDAALSARRAEVAIDLDGADTTARMVAALGRDPSAGKA